MHIVYVTCIKAFFIIYSLISHFFNFTLSPPLCYLLKIINYGMREKKFVCMAASIYHVISKEVENRIMDTIAFLDTYVCVNNPS